MRYSDLIERALRAMRSRSLWLFALGAGALVLPALGVTMLVIARSFDVVLAAAFEPATGSEVAATIAMMESMPGIAVATLAAGLLALPAYVLLETGVALHARAAFAGRTPTVRDLWIAAKAVYRRALAAYLALYAPWLAAYALCAVAIGLLAEGLINGLIARGDVVGVVVWTVVGGVGAFALVIAAFVAMVAGIFAVRAVVLDGSAPLPAVRWSLGVVRRAGRRIATMYGLIYLVQMVYSMFASLLLTPLLIVGVSVVLMAVAGTTASGPQSPELVSRVMVLLMVPTYLVGGLAMAPMFVFASAAWTAFYERLLGRLPLPGEAGAARGVAHE